jgi:hypothetical protein
MEKFMEICVIIVIVLLLYIAYTQEKRYRVYENFVGSFSQALANKEFNFKPDLSGWSHADHALTELVNRV